MEANVTIIMGIITSIVTIIGFIINIWLTKKSIKDAIIKKKNDIVLEQLTDLPTEIFNLMNEKKVNQVIEKKFKLVISNIFAYGTVNAIKIASEMQYNNYNGRSSDIVCYYVLLLCQIKYDLTEIKINPIYWYKIKITDFDQNRATFISLNNNIVRKLELDSFLIIDE